MSVDEKKGERSARKKLTPRRASSNGKSGATVESRVEALELRVAELERLVGNLTGPASPFPEFLFDSQPSPTGNRHPGGVPPRISDEMLFERRDSLLDELERTWPEISGPLLKANDAKEARKAFDLEAWKWDHQITVVIEHADALVAFLKSSEFKRKPSRASVVRALEGDWYDEKTHQASNRLPSRQIANAMAGVPEITWATSLKRCRKNPSKMAVHLRTGEHFRKMFRVPFQKLVWKRAEEGEPFSQYQVGMAYAHGMGVPQDFAKAAEWWRRAAKSGEYRAWFELAESYELGRGVEWDPVKALAWYLATPSGTRIGQRATVRRLLQAMHPEGIAQSHRLSETIIRGD